MNARQHSRLAQQLIAACGGLDEASAVCRVSRAVLSSHQNVHRPECFMTADVIVDLEAYCGEPIYSRAMFETRPAEPVTGDALTETHQVVQAAAALLPLVADMITGKPGARQAYEAAVAKLADEVNDVEAIAASDPSGAHLRAVS